MIAIFDSYDDATKTLMCSLQTAGITYLPLFVQGDGHLPKGSMSPFTYYALDCCVDCHTDCADTANSSGGNGSSAQGMRGTELFFNEVPVPENYEIRQSDNPFGEILHDGYLVGRIHYRQDSFRRVESVDWLDRDGKTRRTDCYDQHGRHYAALHYHQGRAYQKVYYCHCDKRRELIQHNLFTGTITLEHKDKHYIFDSLTNFFLYFLQDIALPQDKVITNSLSHPLFIARRWCKRPNTVLFWQEQTGDHVPGNMEEELLRQKALSDIVFCDQAQLQRAIQQFSGSKVDLHYLSAIGQFAAHDNYESGRIFTLTASDHLPEIEQLLVSFPQATFVVAALTQMSQKLRDLADAHPNLELMSVIDRAEIAGQLERASVYLDINAGAQVLNIVKDAYHAGLLVLALTDQAKVTDYSLHYAESDQLSNDLAKALAGSQERSQLLRQLHEKRGPLSSSDDYVKFFDK